VFRRASDAHTHFISDFGLQPQSAKEELRRGLCQRLVTTMILMLKHEQVGGGPSQFISTLETGRHIIGRDDENSLVLDIESVSREHGCFFKTRDRWFFRDLGSTNGSWLNGLKSGPTNVRLLRDGDLLQLANVAVRVSLILPDNARSECEEIPSLYIFLDGEFKMEFPLARTSSRLALPDLRNFVILGHFDNLPKMAVTFRPEKLELVVASEDATIIVNGIEWGGSVGSGRTLFDRDELDAGPLKFVICDHSTAKLAKERQIKAALASLPPVPGAGVQSRCDREETKVLPRVSTQGEPSAPMGSGSGLFGAGDPPTDLSPTADGNYVLPETGLDQVRRDLPRHIFGEGNLQGGPELQPVRQLTAAKCVAQRFPAPRPPIDEEPGEPRSKAEIILGVVGIVSVLLLIWFLFSIFQSG
jgi:pSer/pThr/pTyr-binding forkhead associated (FHA) protein